MIKKIWYDTKNNINIIWIYEYIKIISIKKNTCQNLYNNSNMTWKQNKYKKNIRIAMTRKNWILYEYTNCHPFHLGEVSEPKLLTDYILLSAHDGLRFLIFKGRYVPAKHPCCYLGVRLMVSSRLSFSILWIIEIFITQENNRITCYKHNNYQT